jgi:hypothetical protein
MCRPLQLLHGNERQTFNLDSAWGTRGAAALLPSNDFLSKLKFSDMFGDSKNSKYL